MGVCVEGFLEEGPSDKTQCIQLLAHLLLWAGSLSGRAAMARRPEGRGRMGQGALGWENSTGKGPEKVRKCLLQLDSRSAGRCGPEDAKT